MSGLAGWGLLIFFAGFDPAAAGELALGAEEAELMGEGKGLRGELGPVVDGDAALLPLTVMSKAAPLEEGWLKGLPLVELLLIGGIDAVAGECTGVIDGGSLKEEEEGGLVSGDGFLGGDHGGVW